MQVSFIVPPTAIPGRLGLLLTLFLCMVNTLNSVSRYSPKADSGPTVLIIWILSCISFQLIAILEYAWIVATLNHKNITDVESLAKEKPKCASKFNMLSYNLDRIMRLAFPITFIVYSLLFWIFV